MLSHHDWLRSTPAQFDESTALLLLWAGDGPGGEEVAVIWL